MGFVETVDGDHGRIETRRHWITADIDWLREHHPWEGLQSIGMAERDVRGLNRQQDEEQWRSPEPAVLAVEEPVALEPVGHWK